MAIHIIMIRIPWSALSKDLLAGAKFDTCIGCKVTHQSSFVRRLCSCPTKCCFSQLSRTNISSTPLCTCCFRAWFFYWQPSGKSESQMHVVLAAAQRNERCPRSCSTKCCCSQQSHISGCWIFAKRITTKRKTNGWSKSRLGWMSMGGGWLFRLAASWSRCCTIWVMRVQRSTARCAVIVMCACVRSMLPALCKLEQVLHISGKKVHQIAEWIQNMCFHSCMRVRLESPVICSPVYILLQGSSCQSSLVQMLLQNFKVGRSCQCRYVQTLFQGMWILSGACLVEVLSRLRNGVGTKVCASFAGLKGLFSRKKFLLISFWHCLCVRLRGHGLFDSTYKESRPFCNQVSCAGERSAELFTKSDQGGPERPEHAVLFHGWAGWSASMGHTQWVVSKFLMMQWSGRGMQGPAIIHFVSGDVLLFELYFWWCVIACSILLNRSCFWNCFLYFCFLMVFSIHVLLLRMCWCSCFTADDVSLFIAFW